MSAEPHRGPAHTVITFTADGAEVTIPAPDVEDWQYEVANLDTYLGLADWFSKRTDEDEQE